MKKIIFFFLLLSIPVFSQYQIDSTLFRAINNSKLKVLDPIFSFTNNYLFITSIFVPSSLLISGMFSNNNYDRNSGLIIFSSELLTGLTTEIVKNLSNRKRPFNYLDNVNVLGDSLSPQKSFPSGHASIIFSIATMLSLRYNSPYVIIPSYFFALLTAYGRIYSGVHYPSDVIVGAAVGVGSSLLINFLYEKYISKNEIKQDLPFISLSIPL